MSEFYKTFLQEDLRQHNPESGRNLFLGAFGKHPGWDDHVEDLGLETKSLIFAKSLLYVDGIGGQIDAGAWEKLDASQQIPHFKHLFVWSRGNQLLIGRLWSSSDGKGRTRYPMIVCVHCSGLRLTWALDQVLPKLLHLEEGCLLTQSAAEVRLLLDRCRSELRHAIQSAGTSTRPLVLSGAALTQFLAHPDLGPNQEGWCRILYQWESQMGPFAPGRFNPRGEAASLRPQQIRVPACGNSASQTLAAWSQVLRTQLDPAVPLLLTLPLEERWLDATVGEPTSHEFFCLRASPKAIPLASEVPYKLDESYRARALQILAAIQNRSGQDNSLTVEHPEDPLPAASESVTQRWLRWLGG